MYRISAMERGFRFLFRDLQWACKFHHSGAFSTRESRGGECLFGWNSPGVRHGPLPKLQDVYNSHTNAICFTSSRCEWWNSLRRHPRWFPGIGQRSRMATFVSELLLQCPLYKYSLKGWIGSRHKYFLVCCVFHSIPSRAVDFEVLFVQIYVWSVKTGRLLDVLSGHEGPVHGLSFSPTSVSKSPVSFC